MGARQSLHPCCTGELQDQKTPRRTTMESSAFSLSNRSCTRQRPLSYRSYLSHDDLNPDSTLRADSYRSQPPAPDLRLTTPGGTVSQPMIKSETTSSKERRSKLLAYKDSSTNMTASTSGVYSGGESGMNSGMNSGINIGINIGEPGTSALDKSSSSNQSETLLEWSALRHMTQYEHRAADVDDDVTSGMTSEGLRHSIVAGHGVMLDEEDGGIESGIQGLINMSVTKFSKQVALEDGMSRQTWTYMELGVCVRRVASGLHKAGMRRHHSLVLVSQPCPEAAILMLATFTLGATFVPLSPNDQPRALLSKFRVIKPAIVITSIWCQENTLWASGLSSSVKCAYEIGGSSAQVHPFTELMTDDGMECPQGMLGKPDDIAITVNSADLLENGQFVHFTYSNIIDNIKMITGSAILGLNGRNHVVLVDLPLSEPFVMVGLIAAGLQQGFKIITMPHKEPKRTLKVCQQLKVTILPVTLTWIGLLGKQPKVRRGGTLPATVIVYGGATTLDADQLQLLTCRLGATRVIRAYGLTETMGPVAACLAAAHTTPCTDLVPLSGILFKVRKAWTQMDLETEEQGNVYVSCPWMSSESSRGELTEHSPSTDSAGWIRTGDIGKLDSRGHLRIRGARKDCIIFQGNELWLSGMERVLQKHVGVADTAVVMTDKLRAAVVLRPGYDDVRLHDLIQFVQDQNSSVALLEEVMIVAAIPRSGSGRILRGLLSQQVQQLLSCAVPWSSI